MTTIYVPKVLELYREFDPYIKFIVVGDRKTPHKETRAFIENLDNAVYIDDKEQEKLGYECSEIIGWNKIMRRNIALLEAIKDGADIIITIDDDNIPLHHNYFNEFKSILTSSFSGLMANTEYNWFNIGEFMKPSIYHRGFPYDFRHMDLKIKMSPVNKKKVGVAAGLWLGDPDIDAMERITNQPIVNQISEVLSSGIIVDNSCFTPFNSQNTAYLADLAPLMMVLVGVGRFDDIWASYIAERIMLDTDYHVHYGRPFVWQERNPHNQWKNLKDEIFGMEFTIRFCKDLLSINLTEGSVLDKLRDLYENLKNLDYLPQVVYKLGTAWCKDLERVM